MKVWKIINAFLILVISLLGLVLINRPDTNLHLIACDVGEGDAILAVYGQTQILFDGGPGSKVIDCLSRHLPFDDREIELVVLSHPQIDHYGGLIEVFRRYRVDTFLASSLDSGTESYRVLKKAVGGSGVRIVNPDVDMVLRVDKLYLDIVHPSEAFLRTNAAFIGNNATRDALGAYASNKDANDFSIVARLSLGNFKALLTGDISPESEQYLLSQNIIQPAEYIKIPHHGSKNGLTQAFLDAVEPKVAVISVGKDNQYGLPNQEILEMLSQKGVKTYRTDETGDIEVTSNGKDYWIKY